MSGYAEAQAAYLNAGWPGVLPLPRGQKHPPPAGFTGRGAPSPDNDQLARWAREHPDGNLGLRLPDGVVGIDVDAHDGKPGAETLAALEAKLGKLPDTAISSARPLPSGIRLYRVPPGRTWRDPGPGVDVIHHGWRYAVTWPSLHPNGSSYGWHNLNGSLPRPDELPWLPEAWVRYLDAGEARAYVESDVDDSWLREVAPSGECKIMRESLTRHLTEIHSGTGRHDAMLRGVSAVVHLAVRGHRGGLIAVQQLREAFEQVTTDRNTYGEFNRALVGALRKEGAQMSVQSPPCQCDRPEMTSTTVPGTERVEPPEGLLLPGEFWEARPVLRHLHDFARARLVAPWAVLGVALVRAVCTVQPSVTLPAIIGSNASLNMLLGLVGPSGSGKGVAKAAARDALDFGDRTIEGFPIGTGEGIAATYMKLTKGTKDEPSELIQYRFRALFHADEIDGMRAIVTRNGASLVPVLRSAYSGEIIGNQNADVQRRLPVARHSYRLGLIVGIQPARSGILLDDKDGGTPQRFLWMPTVDPSAPGYLDDPPPRRLIQIPPAMRGEDGPLEIPICQEAANLIRQTHLARLRGDAGADLLDGHGLLTRLKVAAALGVLGSRLTVTDEDWQLAGVVMAVSDRTREHCRAVLASKAKRDNETRAITEGTRQLIVAEVIEDAAVKRVARTIVRKLTGAGWVTRNDLRKMVAWRDRDYFDAAIDRLVEAGQIEPDETDHGLRYRLAGATP